MKLRGRQLAGTALALLTLSVSACRRDVPPPPPPPPPPAAAQQRPQDQHNSSPQTIIPVGAQAEARTLASNIRS